MKPLILFTPLRKCIFRSNPLVYTFRLQHQHTRYCQLSPLQHEGRPMRPLGEAANDALRRDQWNNVRIRQVQRIVPSIASRPTHRFHGWNR